jgi:hypothetical protein
MTPARIGPAGNRELDSLTALLQAGPAVTRVHRRVSQRVKARVRKAKQ